MISGIHGMFFSSEPQALRAYLRDVLQLPCHDVGDGWLIFGFKVGDLGVHPTGHEGSPPSGTHDISFVCEDIHATVAGIRERGGEIDGEIKDQGFGFTTHLALPGGVRVMLYQAKYA